MTLADGSLANLYYNGGYLYAQLGNNPSVSGMRDHSVGPGARYPGAAMRRVAGLGVSDTETTRLI